MKRFYLFALGLVTATASAQFEIDFDDMTPGDVSPQSAHIVLWPAAGVTDAQVSGELSYSAPFSMLLRENDGTNVDDVLVNCGNKNSGVWSVSWMMYVPSGKTGFWNIQENEGAQPSQWNGQFFVGATASGGTAGMISTDQSGDLVPYPSDAWFEVEHIIDLNAGTHTVLIDGEALLDAAPYVNSDANPASQLGSVNFYSIDADNRYFIDDFVLESNLSTNNHEALSVSVYPNPVQDVLNIQAQETVHRVAIYNVLGKLVYQAAPNAAVSTVNMANFKSGVYFVEVTADNGSKTIKVIR